MRVATRKEKLVEWTREWWGWWCKHRLLKPHLLARDVKWWILHRTTHRYNKIEIKSLAPGYYDVDERMLHGCFQLLVSFVERENAIEMLDYKGELPEDPDQRAQIEHQRAMIAEVKDLYDWWKNKRPRRLSALDALEDGKRPKAFSTWVKSEHGMSFGPDEARDQAINYPEYDKALHTSWEQEKRWDEEDDANLIRLMKIRRFLWT